MVLDGAGNFTINGQGTKPGGGAWAATSDARIKDVQGDYTQGLDDILKLNPVIYTYKGNDTPTEDLYVKIEPQEGEEKQTPYTGSAPYPASPHLNVVGKELVGLSCARSRSGLPQYGDVQRLKAISTARR